MAASQMIDKHQNNLLLQRKANENKTSTDSADRPSIQRFQKITQKIMSKSSTSAHHIPSNSHNSKAVSNSPSKDRRNSVTHIVACPSDDGNRRFSHHTASSTNRLAAANNRFSHQNLSQHKAQDHRLLQTAGSLHPTSSKDRLASSDHTLVSDHGSSRPSSIKVSDRFSHQRSNNLSGISNADALPSLNRVVQAKSAMRKLSRTSSQMSKDYKSTGSVADNNPKGRIETKDLTASHKRQNDQLCKDCKTSIMESVCFINNEGRITAAVMQRLHYCKNPGCAANRNYRPSSSTSSKKALVLKRESPLMTVHRPQHTKNKSHNFAERGDCPISARSSAASSIQGGNYDNKHQDVIQIKENCMTDRSSEGDGESLLTCTNMDYNGISHHHHQFGVHVSSPCKKKEVLDGFLHSENLRCSISRQNEGNRQSNGENNIHFESNTPAGSCISSDNIHDHHGEDGNHEMGSVEQDAIDELHDFKSFSYHGDNEYSCSEDGTDATTTPNSLIRGAFDNISNLDVEEDHPESKVSDPRKSSMARMRRKYLASLREQEAETVRLRKQEIMARKQAGDWMLDCHMEELLHRLAPSGEARVKVLVEAFETVIHHSDSESSQTHLQEHNQMHNEQEEQLDSVHSDTSS